MTMPGFQRPLKFMNSLKFPKSFVRQLLITSAHLTSVRTMFTESEWTLAVRDIEQGAGR